MKQKIRNLINLKTTSAFLSLLFFIILAGGMAIDIPSASAAVPTFTAAHTSTTTTVVTFSEVVDGTLNLGDWTIGGVTPTVALSDVTGIGDTGTLANDTAITFTHPAIATDATQTVNYISGDISDDGNFNQMADATNDAADDAIAPTFTAAHTSTTTTVVTFSETIDGTLLLANWTVGGVAPTAALANVSAAVADGTLANDTAITFTHPAIATDATQTVNYISGNLADNSAAAPVQMADATNDAADDAIAPTFTAAHTSTTTTVVTFSETIDGTLLLANWTVGGVAPTAALANVSAAVADGTLANDTAITFTHPAIATDATQTVNYISGNLADNSAAAPVQMADATNDAADDAIAPTLTSAIFTDTALKVGETSLVTFTFSEAITGFTNADLTIVYGTLTTVAGPGTTWTATFTPTDDLEEATNVIAVDLTGVIDIATNAGVGSTNSSNYAIDTKEPTAAITYSDSSVTSGESLTITATFSEAMAGSPVVKIALSGANTVSATDMTKVTTTSYTYTYTVTAGAGTVTVALSTGTDVATNVITSAPTSGATFTTANAGSAIVSPIPISTIGQAAATPANGGIISKTNADGTSAKVVLPAGALTANAVITINPTAKTEAVASMPTPSGRNIVGNYAYNFTAVSGLNAAVNTFQKALILTFTYTNEQAEGKNEEALKVHYWDEDLSQWVALEDSVVDTVNKTVTAATTHFTYFAIIEGQSSEIIDGDIIQCASSSNPFAVYIVKVVGDTKYIRHIVSLEIFNYYTHLDWNNLKQVDSLTPYSLSGWARVNTGPDGTPGPNDKVYEINGDQSKHWINMTAEDFLTHGGSDAAIYSVNQGEMNLYTTGPDVMSL